MHGIIICIPQKTTEHACKNALIDLLGDLISITPAELKLKTLSNKHGIVLNTTIERSISQMCNIGEYYIEQAIQKGLSQGIEQGIEQGINALVSTLRDINQADKFFLEKLIEKFNLTEEGAKKYL